MTTWTLKAKQVEVWTPFTDVSVPPLPPPGDLENTITLDGVGIGKTVLQFSLDGDESATFSLVSNPQSAFKFVGNRLVLNTVLAVGPLTIVVRATKGAVSVDQEINFDAISVAASWAPGIRPFSAASLANQPLPAGTIYQRLPMPASTGFNYFSSIFFYLDVPAPSETTICTFNARADWGNSASVQHLPMTPGMDGMRHFNPSNLDNTALSLQGTQILNIYNFIRTSNTTATGGPFAAQPSVTRANILTDTGFGSRHPFLGAGTVAAGNSPMVGSLWKEEYTRYGAFNHIIMLSFIVEYSNTSPPDAYGPNAGFPPAINNDGTATTGLGYDGQMFAIKPGTAKPSGLSVYGEAIWTAGQDYGFMQVDRGGSFTFYQGAVYDKTVAGNQRSAGSWTNAETNMLISDINKILPLMQKVGYPLQGLEAACGLLETIGPQIQVAVALGGSYMMKVTRASDSTIRYYGPTGTPDGMLDFTHDVGGTTSLATFCSGTTGFLSTYATQYFRSNFNSIGATAPIIYQSGAVENINGVPAALFNGVDNVLSATVDLFQKHLPIQPADPNARWMSIVVKVTDRAADYPLFGVNVAGGWTAVIKATTGFIEFRTNDGATVIATGSHAVPLNTATFIYLIYAFGGTAPTCKIVINGTVDLSSGSTAIALPFGNTLVGASGGADFFKGHIGEWKIGLYDLQPVPLTIVEDFTQDLWGTP